VSAGATPQRLDPLGGVTAQYFTWSVAIVAVAVACVQLLRHASQIESPALEGLALLCILTAAGAVMDGASPRRFPFTRWRHAALHLLGLGAIIFDRASRDTGEGQSAAWGAVCLAILLMTIGSYRPAGEIVLFSAVSAVIVAGIIVAVAGDSTAAQTAASALARAAPILAVGVGAAAFSRTLVSRLTAWQKGNDERGAAAREKVRSELLAEVSRDRYELIEHRVGPFLQGVLTSGQVTPADIARARGLATSIRRTLLAEASWSWLDDLADVVDDPDRAADRMNAEQRMAVGGLILELRGISTLVPGSLTAVTRTGVNCATTTLSARFTGDTARLRDAAYLAVLRTYFRRATVVTRSTDITVTLEFAPVD
jgi:hypothetical protein